MLLAPQSHIHLALALLATVGELRPYPHSLSDPLTEPSPPAWLWSLLVSEDRGDWRPALADQVP